MRLTKDHPVVRPVHLEHPSLCGLGSVVYELLQTLPINVQRVFISKAADSFYVNGGFDVGTADGKGFLSNQFEHPVFFYNFLLKDHIQTMKAFIIAIKQSKVMKYLI